MPTQTTPSGQRSLPSNFRRARPTRRAFLGALASSAAAMGWFGFHVTASAGRARPNFIIILADDLGYHDLGCYGSPMQTPRLDRMAAEGMRFTDFYSAAPVCTPSRAALLTGCYGQRVGLPEVLFPEDRIGLNPEEITLAELLGRRGYATACIGKWHLGHHPPFLPLRHGFDYFFGVPYSNDMTPFPLMRGDRVIEQPARQETLTERYTTEALAFIARHRDRPFFLYLPHTAPHVPLRVSERFRGASGYGLYGDVVMSLDWSTGEILDRLRTLHLDERTLVVFTSDNGPAVFKGREGGSAYPLRGGKPLVWEGGMRVPCLMRWPGRIPAGRTCTELAVMFDLYPTLARLAGARVPADRVIDGKNIWPLMAGRRGARTPHRAFFYFRGERLEAVRAGKWKLHLEQKLIENGRLIDRLLPRLYDLEADVGETRNVAPDHPDIVRRLERLAERMKENIRRHGRPPGRL